MAMADYSDDLSQQVLVFVPHSLSSVRIFRPGTYRSGSLRGITDEIRVVSRATAEDWFRDICGI